ncbi:MAG: hypothetical protein J7K30_12110 [Deltaproteobacteria bacterium]|nr:hypothetical protein [Deltaproteobacteria bacterium]
MVNSVSFHVKSSELLPVWVADMNWLTYEAELTRFGKSGTYSIEKEQFLPVPFFAL